MKVQHPLAIKSARRCDEDEESMSRCKLELLDKLNSECRDVSCFFFFVYSILVYFVSTVTFKKLQWKLNNDQILSCILEEDTRKISLIYAVKLRPKLSN